MISVPVKAVARSRNNLSYYCERMASILSSKPSLRTRILLIAVLVWQGKWIQTFVLNEIPNTSSKEYRYSSKSNSAMRHPSCRTSRRSEQFGIHKSFVFVHVPKAGGTSVQRALEKWGTAEGLNYFNVNKRNVSVKGLPPAIYAGHAAFSLFLRNGSRCLSSLVYMTTFETTRGTRIILS
jgi:hypothetical protein